MKRVRSTLLVALAMGSLWVPPAAAQITVTTLAEGDDPVDETESIRVSRFLDLTEVDRLAVGDMLSEFDQITALSEDVRIELTCTDGSVLEFGEGFRVMVQAPGEESDCAVLVTLAGLGDVLTEKRTETNIGGTAMITEGTRYAFRLRRDGEALRQEVLVFDGEVEVKRRGAAAVESETQRVEAGRVVELSREEAGKLRTREVQAGEIEWWAKRYASFDVVKARAAGTELNEQQAADLQSRLTALHAAVLSEPKETEPRTELAVAQSTVQVKREASYHFAKAWPRIPPEKLDQASDLMQRAVGIHSDRQMLEQIAAFVEALREQGAADAKTGLLGARAYSKLGEEEKASELARWALSSETADILSEQDRRSLRTLIQAPH